MKIRREPLSPLTDPEMDSIPGDNVHFIMFWGFCRIQCSVININRVSVCAFLKRVVNLISRGSAELIEGVDIGHLPDAGFVEGIDAKVTLELCANHFRLLHETVDHRSSVPIGGVRVTVVDYLIGRAVEAFSSPFAVEEIEVEAALVGKGEPIPRLDERGIKTKLPLRVDEFEQIKERFAHALAHCVVDVFRLFHKECFFEFIK